MPPKVIFLPAGLDGCALYRMFFAHLRMAGSQFVFNPKGLDMDSLKGCQICIVQRLSSKENLEALKIFRNMKMKIIYDLDDDLWSVPSYNPAHKLVKQWLPGFELCASMADLVTVSTAHLKVAVAKALGRKAPRIEVVENALDFDWFKPIAEPYRKEKYGQVILGWAGTDTHTGDTERVFELIPVLLRQYKNLCFELVGQKIPDSWLSEFGDRVKNRSFVPIAEFGVNWASWQWDISLAPVAENNFNKSKSNIKLLEAASLRIPCVTTDFGEYAKFASQSKFLKKAILASTQMDWKIKIERLIVDANYRQAVGQEMYSEGRRRYDISHRVALWHMLFEQVLGR